MRQPVNYIILAVSVFVVLLSGCVAPTGPYDYSALEKSRPRSILVIPPMNNSVEVNAPYIFLSTITRPLAEKGYYVFPVAVIDTFLKENGLPTPAEMNGIPLDKIAEHIGADAVLYVSIKEWGQKYQLLSSSTIVDSTLRLVDVNTGVLLWQATVRGVRTSDDGGGGLLGAIVVAIATQITASVTDYTPKLSSVSNRQRINDESTGLLHGPYFNPDGTIVWRSGNVDGTAVNETWQVFIGIARGEIAAKSYDKELWAEALVKAEGDQQKQREIYIELRSRQLENEKKLKVENQKSLQAENQLYSEKVGSISTTNLSQQAGPTKQSMQIDFSGTYVSEITSDSRKIFPDRNLVITLIHKGDSITGFDSSGTAKISGTIEDGTINFYLLANAMTGFNEADGVWKINADGTQLEGKWTIDGGGGSSGTWDLTKTDSTPIAAIDSPVSNSSLSKSPEIFDISGTYVSDQLDTNWALKNKKRLRIKLSQKLDSIEGTFFKGLDGPIRGSIIGDKVEITWEAGNCNSGEGLLSVDSDGSALKGVLLCRSQGMSKYEVVFRKR